MVFSLNVSGQKRVTKHVVEPTIIGSVVNLFHTDNQIPSGHYYEVL